MITLLVSQLSPDPFAPDFTIHQTSGPAIRPDPALQKPNLVLTEEKKTFRSQKPIWNLVLTERKKQSSMSPNYRIKRKKDKRKEGKEGELHQYCFGLLHQLHHTSLH